MAHATQAGANLVINLAAGSALTLDNVTGSGLTASDFIMATVTVAAGGTYNNPNGATLSSTGLSVVEFAGPTAGSFTNDGTISYNYTGAGTAYNVVTTDGNVDTGALFVNESDGTITVSSSANAVAGVALSAGGEVDNAGTLSVTGAALAEGIDIAANGGGSATAYAVAANSGLITVLGATSVGIHMSGSGIAAPAPTSGQYNVINSSTGAITAHTAILFDGGVTASIDNEGTINGAVTLADAANVLVNHGTINGTVSLGNGNAQLDSSSGVINGVVTVGSGVDSLLLGAENDTVLSGAGVHSIDGGGGVNTISYANATAGVTVDLSLQGQLQDTGVGSDDLSNFQNVIGSAYGDRLVADTNNDTFTGGGGADVFTFKPGAGQDVITDFSAASGDRLNLSAFGNFRSFSDVQVSTTQSGSNTVVNLGNGGSLTLDNVVASNLTANNFILERPTLDLNADGVSDILLVSSTGQVGSWLMNINAQPSWSPITQEASGWHIVGTGDLNGDGSADVILESSGGAVGAWLMSNGLPHWQQIGQEAPGWHVAAMADINGDGTSDVVLESMGGGVGVWTMNTSGLVGGWLTLSQEALGWHVAAAADINGDGRADIVLESSTGQVGLWLTNPDGSVTWQPLAQEGAGWHIAGVADVNGDGRADIVLESATGQVGLWLMGASNTVTWEPLSQEGSGWHVAGVRDYNGDGLADILLESSTGQVGVWLSHPGGSISWQPVSQEALGWHVI